MPGDTKNPEAHRIITVPALGRMRLRAGPAGLRAIDLDRVPASSATPQPHPHLDAAEAALRAYADGRSAPLPALDLAGLTPWQRQVVLALAAIPFGTRVTYGELARRLGRPQSARAIGGACGRNPVPILLPCHRVVAANGLGGFSGGAGWKERLLAHEARHSCIDSMGP